MRRPAGLDLGGRCLWETEHCHEHELVLRPGNKSQNLTALPLVSLVEEMTMRLIDNPGRDRSIIVRCSQTVGEPGRHALPPVSSHSCPGFGARIIQGRAAGRHPT
jgi:hypothetical protein